MPLTEESAGAESCPVCGGQSGRTIYADAGDPITLDRFRVAGCSSCGAAYTVPRPVSFDRYYPPQYRGYGKFVTRVLGALYDVRVSRWARFKPEGGTVLEIGCGAGLMLAAFKRRGWRVLGVERNEAVSESARRAFGIEIVATPIEALPAEARFDLIIMFQVLEHISDPVVLLRECARRLAPGGRVITNVPNFSSWQSRFAKSKWLHLDVPRHTIHFTPRTLESTLERGGLRLAGISFSSWEHDPYGWVESTVNRITGRCNTLTRFLMGLDPFGPSVLLSFALSAFLIFPALLLSVTSWVAGSGALMEAIAIVPPPEESAARQ